MNAPVLPLDDHLADLLPVTRHRYERLETDLSAQETRTSSLRAGHGPSLEAEPAGGRHAPVHLDPLGASVPLLAVTLTTCWVQVPAHLTLPGELTVTGAFGPQPTPVEVRHRFVFADAAVVELSRRS